MERAGPSADDAERRYVVRKTVETILRAGAHDAGGDDDDVGSERRFCPVIEAPCVTAIDRLQNVIGESQTI